MSSIIYLISLYDIVATYFTKKHNISIIFNLLYDFGSGTSDLIATLHETPDGLQCSICPFRQAAASAIKLEHDPGRRLRLPQGQGAQTDRVGAEVEVALDVVSAGDATAHDQQQVHFLPQFLIVP